MKFVLAALMALALGAQPALAATVSNHAALALAALVGDVSPVLPVHAKVVLARLLNGMPAHGPAVTVTADAVVCRAGDVDIAAFSCELTFGPRKRTLSGRRANELFATLGEAGVPSDGAAGTIYEALHAMSCVITPATIAQNSGGGADCSFQPGPP